jgi:hypothetical protein
LDDLEAFGKKQWFKYTDGTKWYVFPKLKLVETLNEENKTAILSSIKSANLKHEDTVIIVG